MTVKIGTRITVTRDETRWPSRGSWPRWRGRTGTVVSGTSLEGSACEYGVVFGAVAQHPDGKPHACGSDSPVYFLRHELSPRRD